MNLEPAAIGSASTTMGLRQHKFAHVSLSDVAPPQASTKLQPRAAEIRGLVNALLQHVSTQQVLRLVITLGHEGGGSCYDAPLNCLASVPEGTQDILWQACCYLQIHFFGVVRRFCFDSGLYGSYRAHPKRQYNMLHCLTRVRQGSVHAWRDWGGLLLTAPVFQSQSDERRQTPMILTPRSCAL